MSKYLRITIIMLFVLVLFSSCSHSVYDALNWQQKKVTADGKLLEWPDPLRFYDDKSKIGYMITNDRANLFLCLEIADNATKMKIIRNGLEFRIDTAEKKSFPIAFIFPTANEIVMVKHNGNETLSESNSIGKTGHIPVGQKVLKHAEKAQLIGFNPPLNGIQSLINNPDGISAAISIDSLGIMSYEAIIPFRTFYKDELTISDTNRAFTYKIRISPLPPSTTHEGVGVRGGMSEGGGMGQGGGGGMGGGRHGGGGHGGGMHGGGQNGGERSGNVGTTFGNSDLYVTTEIKKKLRFTYK